MTFVPLPEIVIQNATPDLAEALVKMNDIGAVCTLQPELDKFAFTCMLIGMITGAICILVYQWTQRRIKKFVDEKNAAMRKEEDLEE